MEKKSQILLLVLHLILLKYLYLTNNKNCMILIQLIIFNSKLILEIVY